ncbi:dermokine isoform X12 [Balaenoptera musculus]|uniref:Dermokine isoform X12 n=1 Tax=Balaenoptera musculus TaxID=9771 RepID=A0A8B8VV86_BALMU|nr:dermokine isoform X12 [Balaenoptera musculus]
MKLQGSLACLLLVLCLGSGEAGPLLSGGESAGAGVMEATGHGVGEAVGQEVGETIKHGVGEATGRGDGEAAGSGVKEAMGPGVGDDLAHGVEDAAHALGNTGSEADRQAENVIQHGVHAAHSSRQGMPGGNGALAAVAQTPYGSGRGSDKPNAEGSSSGGSSNSSSGGSSGGSSGLHWKTLEILIKAATPSEVHVSGESGGQGQGSSGGGEAVNRTNTLNSQTSPGLFNFDAFWMNLKFMLGFINWDAINKGQVSKPSTRILLYFRRLWENFKRNTPFLNWKAITEPGTGCQDVEAVTSKNDDYNQQTHPTATGGQHSAKIPTKGRLATALTPTAWGLPGGEWGVTISSSASRARPDLLQWVKFW